MTLLYWAHVRYLFDDQKIWIKYYELKQLKQISSCYEIFNVWKHILTGFIDTIWIGFVIMKDISFPCHCNGDIVLRYSSTHLRCDYVVAVKKRRLGLSYISFFVIKDDLHKNCELILFSGFCQNKYQNVTLLIFIVSRA